MALPVMPLYWGDLIADTVHLTTEEFGAYMLLLAQQWQYGSLPDEPRVLARVARVDSRRWHRVAPRVLAFFDRIEGRLVQKRLERERENVLLKVALRKHAGALGGRAKALKDKDQGLANAKAKLKLTGYGSSTDSPQSQDSKDSSTLEMKFAQFWQHYPRKEGRLMALRELEQALKVSPFSEIMLGVARMVRDEPRYVPMPAKWLRECRWTDQPAVEVMGKQGVWSQIADEITEELGNGRGDKVIDLAKARG